jgi:3-carboxy-cis,cis-muconate cycloisomerase
MSNSVRLDDLLGDPSIARQFSDEAELAGMLAFEAALAGAQSELGLIPAPSAAAIDAACTSYRPDPRHLAAGMARDGLAVPALVAGLRENLAEPHRQWLHLGATSQDVIDTSLTLRLKTVTEDLDRRLIATIEALDRLTTSYGALPLMAQTRMQQALPMTVADRIEAWRRPLERHRERLAEIRPRLLVVQFGGPIGVRGGQGGKEGGKGDAVAAGLAARLGLGNAQSWHSARDRIAEFAGWLSMVTGALGKIGQDVALMAQNEVGTAQLASGGTSSAMPHKNNPVTAELLVTIARFNAGMLGTLHQSLVHENERSGAAWTLEWLLLPQMCIAAGASLRHAGALLAGLRFAAPKDANG